MFLNIYCIKKAAHIHKSFHQTPTLPKISSLALWSISKQKKRQEPGGGVGGGEKADLTETTNGDWRVWKKIY